MKGEGYQLAAVAVVRMKDDGCLDDRSRGNNGKQTYLGNIEEVKWTRLDSGFNLRCVDEEEGEENRKDKC